MTARHRAVRVLRAAVLAALVAAAAAAAAAAQPGQTPVPGSSSAGDRIAEAMTAAEDKDWGRVVSLLAAVPTDAAVTSADHAEAHRLLGIAEFYRGHYDVAEGHFHAYLKIDLDGQLDIGLHAPDVVQFFDNVRAKHAAELRALRPRTRRWAVLNLVPPAGQFQNKQPVKAWVLGGLGATLLAANIGTYVMLERWCDDVDRTCESDTESRAASARTLKKVNSAAGVALIGLYIYGVIDGYRHYRRASATVTVTPMAVSSRGAGLGISGTF